MQLVTGSRHASTVWTALPDGHMNLKKQGNRSNGNSNGNSFAFTIEKNADRLKNIHLTFSVPATAQRLISPELYITALRYYIRTNNGENNTHEEQENLLVDWNGAALLGHNVSQNERYHSDEPAHTFFISVLPFVRQVNKEEYIPLSGLVGLDLQVVIEFTFPMTGVELTMDGIIDESNTRRQVIRTASTEHADHLYENYHVWTSLAEKDPFVLSACRTFSPTSSTTNVMDCNLGRFGDEDVGPRSIEWLLLYTESKVDTLTISPLRNATLRLSGLYAATVAFHKTFGRPNPLPRNLYLIHFEGGLREQRIEKLNLVVQTFDPIIQPITVYGMMRGPSSTTVGFRKKTKTEEPILT